MNNKTNPVIWLLTDDQAGNVNQCLGIAESLGWGFIRKNISYTIFGAIINILRGVSRFGIDLKKSDDLSPPYPDIIITAGRKPAPLAAYIKKKHPKCFMVQIMWPNYPVNCFDLIAIPKHDGWVPKRTNTMTTLATPHRVTPELLASGAEEWKDIFAAYPTPHIGLIVGGTTKYGTFTAKHARELGENASELAKKMGGSLLITTSRRTEKEAEQALRESITVPHYFHDWRAGGNNPYFGLLALSDIIIVTGDSMSMCSEVCASGKKIMIYSPANITPKKYKRLHHALYEAGHASPFPGEIAPTYSVLPNSANEVAQAIRERYGK